MEALLSSKGKEPLLSGKWGMPDTSDSGGSTIGTRMSSGSGSGGHMPSLRVKS
jgi:hypothetical protein